MKKLLGNILKIAVPLALGIVIAWLAYDALSPEDVANLKTSFREANYWWILFSLVFAWLSHVSRAYRWKYTLEPLGLKPRFWNSYHSVMVGYFFNLGIPRSGEVARCGFLSRYERMPFPKVMGTVIAERVADLVILLSFAVVVAFMQLPILRDLIEDMTGSMADKIFNPFVLIGVPVGGVLLLIVVFRFIKRSTNPLIQKVWGIIAGLLDGMKSIWSMKKKWAFLGHTAFIWIMYVTMFYVCFYSLPNVQQVPIGGVLAGFVLGGFAVVITPGGIGAYPVAIMAILGLYGVNQAEGLAFGWIVWAAQNALLVVLGMISLISLPQINKNAGDVQADHPNA